MGRSRTIRRNCYPFAASECCAAAPHVHNLLEQNPEEIVLCRYAMTTTSMASADPPLTQKTDPQIRMCYINGINFKSECNSGVRAYAHQDCQDPDVLVISVKVIACCMAQINQHFLMQDDRHLHSNASWLSRPP